MIRTTLAVLITCAVPILYSQTSPTRVPRAAGSTKQDFSSTNDVAQIISALQDVRVLALALPKPGLKRNTAHMERVGRGIRAMRAAGQSDATECRHVLLGIVDACGSPSTVDLALDAMAALRKLGEPRTYFEDLLTRAVESPYLAAPAMRVLAWDPSENLVQLARYATRRCLRIDERGLGHAAMQSALCQLLQANGVRIAVDNLIEGGERAAADRLLLRELWMSYSDSTAGAHLASARTVHRPTSVLAQAQLVARAKEDADGLRAVVDSMTLEDFLMKRLDPLPEDHADRATRMRANLLSLLPEVVRTIALPPRVPRPAADQG